MDKNNDGWIEHDGKGMPVDGEEIVYVKFRDSTVTNYATRAISWGDGGFDSNWNHDEACEADIIAYRIVEEPKS